MPPVYPNVPPVIAGMYGNTQTPAQPPPQQTPQAQPSRAAMVRQQATPVGNVAAGVALSNGISNLVSGGADTGVDFLEGLGNLSRGRPWSSVPGPVTSTGDIPMAGGGSLPANSMEGQLSAAAPYAGAALGAYGLYDIGKKWGRGDRSLGGIGGGALKGAASGAAVGNVIPGVGTAIGGTIGAIYGALGSAVKAGKHEDQIKRDAVRAGLQKHGFLDQGFNVTLADGSKFNMGIDGGARDSYGFSGGRRPFEVNSDNPFHTQAAGWANPLAEIIAGGNDKLKTDFAGYLANAAMSNAQSMEGVRANILGFFKQLGFDEKGVTQKLGEMHQQGVITAEELQAYLSGVNTLLRGDPKTYVMGPVAAPTPTPVAPSAPAPTVIQGAPATPIQGGTKDTPPVSVKPSIRPTATMRGGGY